VSRVSKYFLNTAYVATDHHRSTIIGGFLGGVLANPAESMETFKGTVFEKFPYLLPNLFCAGVVVFGLTVGILFLEETHEDRKFDRDTGLEAGQWILRKVWNRDGDASFEDKDAVLDEMRSMLEDHDAYSSTRSSPTLCSSSVRTSMSEPPAMVLDKEMQPAPTVRGAFTKQICLVVVCYGILAL
jgi:hypothetical protein